MALKPRRVARLLLVALAPVALDGCVSLRVTHVSSGGASGVSSVAVAVYENAEARNAGKPISHPVYTHLYRLEGRGAVSVARSLAPEWRLEGLPPGDYRLEATKEIDSRGDIRDLPQGGAKTFALAAGETARVEVLRKKVPVALIVLSAITVVALVVVLVVLDREGALPVPPPLPPLPIPPESVAIAVDLAFAAHAAEGPAPGVADVFPAPGSVVAARRVAVTFLLSAPLGGGPARGALAALGSLSGEIPGEVSYLPREQLLRFLPGRDFTPGETVTVTLDLGALRGPDGARGEGRVSTRFAVPEE